MTAQVEKWQALQIRVTTFHGQPRVDVKSELILPVFSVEPDSFEVKANELRRTEIAALGPGKLVATSALNRVDWIWQAMEETLPEVALGQPEAAVNQFLSAVVEWGASQGDIVRLAVGGVFGIPVPNKERGYQVLDELIPELSVDPSTTELVFQINRPAKETVGDTEMVFNNIEKWSCRRVSRNEFAFSSGGAVPVVSDDIVIALHAACEIDINTDVMNSTPFSSEMVRALVLAAGQRLLKILAR